MATIINQKEEIFGNISALNVLNDDFPKIDKSNSVSSINNDTNSTNFLIDLTTALAGAKALKEHMVDCITYRLDQFEDAIKDGLKRELKEMVACSVDPSVPPWFQTGGSGVELRVPKIDFYDTMKVNPETTEGSLLFTDVPPNTNSQDFNTYLNYKIQSPSLTDAWGNSMGSNEIVTANFNPVGTTQNNTITFTTDYGKAGTGLEDKKLTDFNNDFIDYSLTLFGSPGSNNSQTMFNLIIEELFGSISATKTTTTTTTTTNEPPTTKSKSQLKIEAEIRRVLDCILNSENDVIDDSFFTFDNPTLAEISREADNRSKGIIELATCGNLAVQINSNLAVEISNSLSGDSTTMSKAQEAKKVAENLDKIADTQASFASETNKPSVKGNFFVELVRKFCRILLNLIISPKFISLFAINHQIIYGQGSTYDGAIDFIKKNKKLVKNVAKIVLNIFLNLLLQLALKYLSIKLRQKFTDDEIEKAKQYVSIVFSYLPVGPEVFEMLGQIKKL